MWSVWHIMVAGKYWVTCEVLRRRVSSPRVLLRRRRTSVLLLFLFPSCEQACALRGPWQPALRGFRKTIANVFFTWKSCCHFASNFCANTSFSQPGSLEQALICLGLRFESFISTFTMDEMLLLISNSLFAHYFKIYLKELLSLSLTHTQGNHSPNGCNNQGYARLNSEARNIIWVAHVGGRSLNTWQSSHAFLKQ